MLSVPDPLFQTCYGYSYYLRLTQQVYVEFGELRMRYSPTSLSQLAQVVDQLIRQTETPALVWDQCAFSTTDRRKQPCCFSRDELLDLQELLHGSSVLVDLYDYLHGQLISVER